MQFVFATDSLKGSLSSSEAAAILESAARRHFPGCRCVSIEVADGGEGTVSAVCSAVKHETRSVEMEGPLGEKVVAKYGLLEGGQAIVEVASAAGITLVPRDELDPLAASSYGVGQVLLDALDQGCDRISFGLGGSATNDGGMGMLSALGVKFYDADGSLLHGSGAELAQVDKVDVSDLDPRIATCEFTLMSDVDNPLLGPEGATATFGPQKGADAEKLRVLESGMHNYSDHVAAALGVDLSSNPGAGAAGGIGFASLAFLHGEFHAGIEALLDLVGFDELLEEADLVVTGEGHADEQTLHGKVMSGIAARARTHGVPVVGVVGGMDREFDRDGILGLAACVPTVPDAMDISEAMAHSVKHYELAAERLFSLLRVGFGFKR